MDKLSYYNQIKHSEWEILFQDNISLVNKIAHHLIVRLPSSILVEDLVQAGMIGLLEAAKNFNSTKGASFATYAGIRVRGAMIDEVRRSDWMPRSVYQNSKKVTSAINYLEQLHGRDATATEIAKYLDVSLDVYFRMLHDFNAQKYLGYDEAIDIEQVCFESKFDNNNDPINILHDEDKVKILSELIGNLPDRERLIIALYFDEELNLKEIGEILSVSESRVCQIINQVMVRLRAKVEK